MTIEECCEKFWPEQCRWFDYHMRPDLSYVRRFAGVIVGGTVSYIEILALLCKNREYWTPFIACVAAMHWQNREHEWGDKGDAIFFNLGEQIPPEKVEAMNKAFDEANKALVAQKAWSELAKGV